MEKFPAPRRDENAAHTVGAIFSPFLSDAHLIYPVSASRIERLPFTFPQLYISELGVSKEGNRMAINERELEMALEGEFGADFEGEFEVPSSDDTAASSAAASQRASRDLYAKYRTACKGRSILKRLTKTKISPIDESIMLQKRIDGLPQLFTDLAELKRRPRKCRTRTIETNGRG